MWQAGCVEVGRVCLLCRMAGGGGGEERSRGHVSFLEEQPGSPFSVSGPSIFLWPRLGLDESSF